MNLPVYEGISFGWKGQGSALRFWAAMYCVSDLPRKLSSRYRDSKQRSASLKGGLALWLHILPYVFMTCVLGRYLLHGVLGLRAVPEELDAAQHLLSICKQLSLGLFLAILVALSTSYALGDPLAGGLAAGIALGSPLGIAIGLAQGFAGSAGGLASSFASGFLGRLALGPFFGVKSGLVIGCLVLPVSTILSSALSTGHPYGLTRILVLALAWCSGLLRLHYLPLHWWLLLKRSPHQFRSWHPTFWDYNCKLAFPRLDGLLVHYAEHNRADGLAQIENLISDYASQRPAALRARTVLTARAAAGATRLTVVDELTADLPEGDKGYLTQTSLVRERVLAISRQQ